MAYDEFTAERVRRVLFERKLSIEELTMMGGLCFMLEDKMLCGILPDKTDGQPLLMARIGPEAKAQHPDPSIVVPINFSKRPMKGYVFIRPGGFDTDRDLEKWIDLCLAFNPIAKSSRKR